MERIYILRKEGNSMNVELYIHKAILQFGRNQNEQAVESLNLAIKTTEEDMVSLTQAHCILGEYFFINSQYREAFMHLHWIAENADDLEQESDDLLSDEINRAQVLMDIIERFSINTDD